MPGLRDIRKRIRSVKNTQQITKAMKMVAASRLRRAQKTMVDARPYGWSMREMFKNLALRVDNREHPFLRAREQRRIEIMVVSSDRGLCGGFNSNILRFAEHFLREHKGKCEDISVVTIGRKAREYFKRRSWNVRQDYPDVLEHFHYGKAGRVARAVSRDFIEGDRDAVFVVYNEFKSVISQKVVSEQLLPIPPADNPGNRDVLDYLYEPDAAQLLEELLPEYINSQIYRILLESLAAESAARMTAMEAATKNAGEVIGKLTLKYNRARQAAITKELVEVVSGAEAL